MAASAEKWDLRAHELALIFLFWTALATLSVANRLVDPRGYGFRFGNPGPIFLAFIEAWIWAALTPLIFWLSSRFRIERSNWWIRIPLLIAAGIAIAVFAYVILSTIRFELVPVRGRRSMAIFAPLRELGRFRFVNQFVVYIATLAAGFAREYFVRDQARQHEATQLRAQLAEARLESLRMQLNPHFLFNTLNAMSALVERDPAGTRRMIARLSELLRNTLESHAADEIPLRGELLILDKYIELMQIRFQQRLVIVRDIESAALDVLVPNLVLQPIVENALEHGVSAATGEARVAISATREGAGLVLAVRDNGPGFDQAGRPGVGLSNTRARLAQLYGDRGSLIIASPPGGGTVVEVRIPWRTEPAHA